MVDWRQVSEVAFVLGGDHGGGVFCQVLRVLAKLQSGEVAVVTYQVG